jgi:hypothetical protein
LKTDQSFLHRSKIDVSNAHSTMVRQKEIAGVNHEMPIGLKRRLDNVIVQDDGP